MRVGSGRASQFSLVGRMSPSTVNVERSGNIHLPPGGRKIKSLPGATTTSDWAGLADLLPPDERLGLPARQEVA